MLGAERKRKDAQNVDKMLQLSWGRLSIFASGTHVDDGPTINIEARQNTANPEENNNKLAQRCSTLLF
jgi:hypothetical protein